MHETALHANATKKTLVKKVIGTAAVFGLLAVGSVAGASSASAASCTDSASTLYDATIYRQVVQMRTSASCGGTVWFRINSAGSPSGQGRVTLQVKNRAGTVVNGPSQDVYLPGSATSYVSPYITGYPQARLHFVNNTGGQASFYTAWYGIAIEAR